MKGKLRFGVLTQAHHAEVREKEIPDLGDEEVLVKQDICYICTTDYGQWLGLREHQGYPMANGHECSGVIVEMGKNVSPGFKVGDRVAFGYYYCGHCEACKRGNTDLCENKVRPFSADGYYGNWGFSTYCVKDQKILVKVDESVPAQEAGFIEPLASVVSGIRRLRVAPMETVVVMGAGTMGILNAQVARVYGARVIVAECMPKKLETARNLGFECIDFSVENTVEAVKHLTNGRGCDVVILAVGATSANEEALQIVKKSEGRILCFAAGYPAPKCSVTTNDIHYRKLELIGAYEATAVDFLDAAKLLAQGRVDVKPLIEKIFPLDEIQRAYELASTPGMYRVGIDLSK